MEEKETSSEKEIYNKKLAGFLLLTGCRLLDVKKDKNDEFVFKFKYTDKAKRNIKAYFGNGEVDMKEE